MKTGKFISLGDYKNIKIGFGTIDHINLKTIYLQLNSWVEPNSIDDDFDRTILRTRRLIKEQISNLKSPHFKPESIVDLDIKTKGIKVHKKSFMDLEITLFVNKVFDIKSPDTKNYVKNLITDMIDTAFIDKNLFNFNLTKK